MTEQITRAVVRGLDWLAVRQLSWGEFNTNFWYSDQPKRPGVPDSSPFVTAHVVHALDFVKDARARGMQERALKFLRGEMEGQGFWRYRSRRQGQRWGWSLDMDDTSCVSYVLRQHNIAFPENRAWLVGNRNARGIFYTWFTPRRAMPHNFEWLRLALAYARCQVLRTVILKHERLERNDVECVVNANVVWYLGECAETNAAIDYLIDTARQGREAQEMRYYLHRNSFYYALSRAYANGIARLDEAKEAIVENIRAEWNHAREFENDLQVALAACTLLNFRCDIPELARAMDWLVARQDANGGWREWAWIGYVPFTTRWGSAEMTTAVCVEALARYANTR